MKAKCARIRSAIGLPSLELTDRDRLPATVHEAVQCTNAPTTASPPDLKELFDGPTLRPLPIF